MDSTGTKSFDLTPEFRSQSEQVCGFPALPMKRKRQVFFQIPPLPFNFSLLFFNTTGIPNRLTTRLSRLVDDQAEINPACIA